MSVDFTKSFSPIRSVIWSKLSSACLMPLKLVTSNEINCSKTYLFWFRNYPNLIISGLCCGFWGKVKDKDPEKDKFNNWWPVPNEDYYLIFRFYAPADEIINLDYVLPKLE